MITESRHSPLSYLRAKGIEPDWPTLYSAFGEPESMRVADISEGELDVEHGPVGSNPDGWTTEYVVRVRFELRRGIGGNEVDATRVNDAFDAPAIVMKSEWTARADDSVVEIVSIDLTVRERFETVEKSATEPTYTVGPAGEPPAYEPDWVTGWTGATAEWATPENPDQSTTDDVELYTGTDTWITADLDGETVTFTHDGDGWVDEDGNRYDIDAPTDCIGDGRTLEATSWLTGETVDLLDDG